MDYKGYSEEKLLCLCNENNVKMTRRRMLYWTSEIYSAGESYRQYANFPKYFPLNIYSSHGVDDINVEPHEIENNAPYMLVFSDEKRKIYEAKSNKKVFNITPPLILYRRMNHIEKDYNAKGTLAFPLHSTRDMDIYFDKMKYIEQLKKLPSEMQPVCVSLHMYDIEKGEHKTYMNEGIPCFCAGHTCDYRYAKRFYSYLKYFKYATSNQEGSCLYYAIEMGIPFFLLGDIPIGNNIANNQFQKGFFQHHNDEVYRLFAIPNKVITAEQLEYVNKRISNDNSLTGKELKIILYKALLLRFIQRIYMILCRKVKFIIGKN